MRVDARAIVAPVAALLLLTLTLYLTVDALRRSGAWRTPPQTTATPENPYRRLDTILATAAPNAGATVRDPFDYAREAAPPTPRPQTTPTPRPAPAPERPVLTAIIFDNDPRALVTLDGRNYTVRVNSLFADYRVASINRDEVVLEQGASTLILKRPVGGQ